MKSTVLAALLVFCTLSLTQGNPSELLATLPEVSSEEKEMISLLQIDRTEIDSNGVVSVSIYNPTKFILTSGVVKIRIPSMNIERIYFSNPAVIPPFKVGYLNAETGIHNATGSKFTVEIVRLKYSKASNK